MDKAKENEQPKGKVLQIVLSDNAIEELSKNLLQLKENPEKVLRMGKSEGNQIVFMHQDFKKAHEVKK